MKERRSRTARTKAPLREKPKPTSVYTMGHSTLNIAEFISRLQAHGVSHVIDIRTIPRSRHNPQFSSDAMAVSLPRAGLTYTHMPALGGLRRPKRDSPNSAWRNLSFRGYADYMQTRDFQKALRELIALSKQSQVVIVCAEAVHWRCHRSLVADALLVRGIPVEHISSATRRQLHRLTPFAHVEGKRITYPTPPEPPNSVP